jgi:phosphomannomutase
VAYPLYLILTSISQYPYKLQYPETIGKYKVTGIRDLTVGYDSDTKDNQPTLPVSSSSEMITFKLDNGCVFTIRTSGTEPKIKYYCELAGASAEEAANEQPRIQKRGIKVFEFFFCLSVHL